MCLAVIFLRDNNRINKQCKLAITNITCPQPNYLDQGNWPISVNEPTQMEIKCTDHTHVKTLQPPITLISLQPSCSAFLPQIKLPSYFEYNKYSKCFHVALQPFICPNSPQPLLEFGHHFKLSKITSIEVENLKALTPDQAIPIDQLRAQIANFDILKPIKPNLGFIIL